MPYEDADSVIDRYDEHGRKVVSAKAQEDATDTLAKLVGELEL